MYVCNSVSVGRNCGNWGWVRSKFWVGVIYLWTAWLLFWLANSKNQVIKRHSNFIYRRTKLEAVNYYHKELHLGCCSSPRSASAYIILSFLSQSYILTAFVNLWLSPLKHQKMKNQQQQQQQQQQE